MLCKLPLLLPPPTTCCPRDQLHRLLNERFMGTRELITNLMAMEDSCTFTNNHHYFQTAHEDFLAKVKSRRLQALGGGLASGYAENILAVFTTVVGLVG